MGAERLFPSIKVRTLVRACSVRFYATSKWIGTVSASGSKEILSLRFSNRSRPDDSGHRLPQFLDDDSVLAVVNLVQDLGEALP
jgi:hypothetical protein